MSPTTSPLNSLPDVFSSFRLGSLFRRHEGTLHEVVARPFCGDGGEVSEQVLVTFNIPQTKQSKTLTTF